MQVIVSPAASPVARCRATIVYGVCRYSASQDSTLRIRSGG
jgi:hypothetical protein